MFAHAQSTPSVDPTHIDERIERVYRVLSLDGSLQLDPRAVDYGANEWSIKVEIRELAGNTQADLDAAWLAMRDQESQKQFLNLSDMYTFPTDATTLTEQNIAQFAADNDIHLELVHAFDDVNIRKWILEDLATRAAARNIEYELDQSSKSRRSFDYYRYHYDDSNSEVIGDDVLLIRGVRKVIVVRINYVHA